MRIKLLVPTLFIAAASLSFAPGPARAGNVAVRINGYLPAPPGVAVQVDAGQRPYYVQNERRVYMERDRRHHKKRHNKRHHEDNGNHYGHDRHEEHGR